MTNRIENQSNNDRYTDHTMKIMSTDGTAMIDLDIEISEQGINREAILIRFSINNNTIGAIIIYEKKKKWSLIKSGEPTRDMTDWKDGESYAYAFKEITGIDLNSSIPEG